ncbi:Citrate synthase, glyoxysomal [Linum perenne]
MNCFPGANYCSSSISEIGRKASCSTFQQLVLFREFPLYAGLIVRFREKFHLSFTLTCFVDFNTQISLFFYQSGRGNREYKPNPRLARVLDILFILHAEHEMNCSTSAARHLASRYVITDTKPK